MAAGRRERQTVSGGRSAASRCARRLKVLADDSRLAIVKTLMRRPKRVWELGSALELDQSLLSHHLKVLRREGLVKATRDGKAVLYSLAPGVESAESCKMIDLGCCRLSFE